VIKVFNNISEGRQDISKPKDRWENSVVYGLKKMIVLGCRKTSRDKDAYSLILMELKVLTGQWGQWRGATDSQVDRNHYVPSHALATFSSHLRLALPRFIFLSAFAITFFLHFSSLRYVSCPPYLLFFDLIPGTVSGL
jgi:hypothetical protein